MARRKAARKVRTEFRPNRQVRRRSDDWTRRLRAAEDTLADTARGESVRAKGELSRKRTILVDEHDQPLVDQSLWLRGTVVKVHGLICYVDHAAGRIWECTVRRVLRTLLIKSRAPVTVGDRVWFSDQAAAGDGRPIGVIERVEPRTGTLSRRDRRQREQVIVANADQMLALGSVAEPRLRPHLLDRFLVAAAKGGLRPILCFNKMDLLAAGGVAEKEGREVDLAVLDVIEEFRALGHTCLCTSAVTGAGLDELRDVLAGHVTVLAGQSGVGKSTLLNALQPSLHLPTQPVSDENEKGRHTTTLAELFRLDCGGFVVDTPGIRGFELWDVQAGELETCFVEFLPHVAHCRFSNCTHTGEEDCAVAAAVEAGQISPRRYYSYLKMFAEAGGG